MNSLLLENFQKHKKIKINFEDRITTITGPTDSGKSAVLRGLKWVARNDPKGEEFIQEDAKRAKGTLVVDNNEITRERGTGVNLYTLNGKEYKAFGNDVPDEIAAVLNVNELNFQSQFDSPFWFSETAGEVSRQLNQIVDLGKIDSVLSFLDNMARKQTTKVQIIEENREQIKKEGKDLEYTKQAHTDLLALEKMEADLWTDEERKEELSESIENIVGLDKEIHETALIITDAEHFVFNKGEKWQAASKHLQRLSTLLEMIVKMEEEASISIPPSIIYLEQMLTKYHKTKEQRERLSVHINAIKSSERNIYDLTAAIKKNELIFKKEMGDKCTLCGKPLK